MTEKIRVITKVTRASPNGGHEQGLWILQAEGKGRLKRITFSQFIFPNENEKLRLAQGESVEQILKENDLD
jgi:hypothetical protein